MGYLIPWPFARSGRYGATGERKQGQTVFSGVSKPLFNNTATVSGLSAARAEFFMRDRDDPYQ